MTINAEHIKHWRIGEVQVTRIVENFPFQVPAGDLLAEGRTRKADPRRRHAQALFRSDII